MRKIGVASVGSGNCLAVFGVCVFLLAAVWLVFGQTLRHEFVNFDDGTYVYDNPQVVHGLNLKGMEWAFTHSVAGNWHPLTMMSHMLDCQFYGLHAGGHHLTNLLLHAATVILLFLVLWKMTGALWRSAFVAAVFAIHPLRVESVAWVSERKDVLSGVFFMLTLGAYARYVERAKAQSSKSKVYYGLTLLFFGLGLMCKPMLVTVPFVLLLLDYWPLDRFEASADRLSIARKLVVEKVPFIVFSIAMCLVTLLVQQPAKGFSISLRISNALVSCVAYCGQMFYPVGLALLYPYPNHGLPIGNIVLASLLLVAVTAGAFWWRQKHPQILVGWLWYLGMLVPVIGLIQVGIQARADRYTYLPQIGLYILVTWTVVELTASWRNRRRVLGVGAVAVLAALITCARTQTTYWRDSESLWTHTLACTSGNSVAHSKLGHALHDQGRLDEAVAQLEKALEINPGDAEFHYNLGNAFLQQGHVEEAIARYQKALEINPDYAEAHNNLGDAFRQQGRMEEAIAHYQRALEIKPDYAEVHNNLGVVLAQRGRKEEAISHYQKALAIKPDYTEAHYNLGNAFLKQGQVAEAISHYQKALAIKPDYIEVQNNLALVLATCPQASLRNGIEAVRLAERANRLAGGENPFVLCTLAAADAEAGRFPEAIETAQRALQLAEAQSNTRWPGHFNHN